MAFYDLTREDRLKLMEQIRDDLAAEAGSAAPLRTQSYFAHEDTYIRKSAYAAVGTLYNGTPALRKKLLHTLHSLHLHNDFRIRQTVINAASEIGKTAFKDVSDFFDTALFDPHHAPRNAVIGSLKKMGEVNPLPVFEWAKQYLLHPDKEIRREICHGIELRGRRFPQDILPLLRQLQYDDTLRVRDTLVHVIGQISYKKGCLETVIAHLNTWDNRLLVADALTEIIDVHSRYKDFAIYTAEQAAAYIASNAAR